MKKVKAKFIFWRSILFSQSICAEHFFFPMEMDRAKKKLLNIPRWNN